jgi:acyl-coenzyme A synthetase/AMP-(fatty) acid ligase
MGARVSGRQNSFSGTVVAAEVVGVPGTDEVELKKALFQHCRASLPSYAVPRMIAFVASLPTTASGKILREKVVQS